MRTRVFILFIALLTLAGCAGLSGQTQVRVMADIDPTAVTPDGIPADVSLESTEETTLWVDSVHLSLFDADGNSVWENEFEVKKNIPTQARNLVQVGHYYIDAVPEDLQKAKDLEISVYGDQVWQIRVPFDYAGETPDPDPSPGPAPSPQPNPRPDPGPTPAPNPKPPIPHEPPTAKTPPEQMLDLINQERTAVGKNELQLDAGLSRLAVLKSEDMRDLFYFSHISPTYGSPFEMLQNNGFRCKRAGENIVKGPLTVQQFHQEFMNSKGHRANIMYGGYTHVGIGFATDGRRNWVTELFCTPEGQ